MKPGLERPQNTELECSPGNPPLPNLATRTLSHFVKPPPLQVVVFSFSTCPFCVKAKALLNQLGAKYEAVELDQLPGKEGMQLRAELAEVRVRGCVVARIAADAWAPRWVGS